MKKAKEIERENHTDHPFDNGAIGAIASVASAGAAVGAAVGTAAALSGLLIGAAIGGTMGALGSLMVAEEMEHPDSAAPVMPITPVEPIISITPTPVTHFTPPLPKEYKVIAW
jgi:hypothetical protein